MIVHLVNGSAEYEGTIELYYYGVWATVCADQWDLDGADIVCRDLGFGPAIAARKQEIPYRWIRYYTLCNNLVCMGDESTIESCSVDFNYNCPECLAAGVRCAAPNGT